MSGDPTENMSEARTRELLSMGDVIVPVPSTSSFSGDVTRAGNRSLKFFPSDPGLCPPDCGTTSINPQVTVKFDSITINNDRDNNCFPLPRPSECFSGEWLLAAYVQGKEVRSPSERFELL